MPRLVAVVVNGLLAKDNELRALLVDNGFQQLRDRERLNFVVGLNQNATVCAHRECGADGLLTLLRADRNRDDFRRSTRLLKAHGFFDGNLVEWVHRHFHVGGLDACLIRLHADFDVVIDHALDGNEHLHRQSFLWIRM